MVGLTAAESGGRGPVLQHQGHDPGRGRELGEAVAPAGVGLVDGEEALVQLAAAGRAEYPELGQAGAVALDDGGVGAGGGGQDGGDEGGDGGELHLECGWLWFVN